jgi:phosphomannomutase
MQKLSLAEKLTRYQLEEPSDVLRAELQKNSAMELEDKLADLLFGTAGLRGKMEAGYNRMNQVSVFRFGYALAQVGKKFCGPKPKVVIGFDARANGLLFSQDLACALNAFGCQVECFPECVPTPLVAFATKHLAMDFGVMITASHNPSADNGIKVFDNRGAQVEASRLRAIEGWMALSPLRSDYIDCFHEPLPMLQKNIVSTAIWEAYLREIEATRLFDDSELDFNEKIVYTPLHGVGHEYFMSAMSRRGFKNIISVPAQSAPDGAFPSVSFPNPEEEHTLDLAHALAHSQGAAWVFANDPDADRLQVSCLQNGAYRKLTGNEMGAILGYFAINAALRRGVKPLVASSIVSSRMLSAISESLGATYVDALTGFGNIVDVALAKARELDRTFVFGYEEAIGFLVGQAVLDKDGLNAGVRFAEVVGWLKAQNKTIWQFLDELYLRFGLFVGVQWSERFDGANSLQQMNALMQRFRDLDVEEAKKIFGVTDLQKFDLISPIANQKNPYYGLISDVIIFESKNELRVIVRPSGTEPKIKFYTEACEPCLSPDRLQLEKTRFACRLSKIQEEIRGMRA